MNIRWAIRRDLYQLLEIEGHSSADPWNESEFILWLKQRSVICLVAEDVNDDIAGFIMYSLERGFYEIINIAVHRNYRREGVGTLMMKRVMKKCGEKRDSVKISVPDDNLQCHLFLKSLGLTATVDGDHYDFIYRAKHDAYQNEQSRV